MGRHHIKLPDHLYLSPPSPQPPSTLTAASNFFASGAGISYSSASSFLYAASNSRALEHRIPGFKTSAAFLTALRANIDLQADIFDSPIGTPDSLRPIGLSTTSLLPPPSPLVHAMSSPTTIALPAVLNLPETVTMTTESSEGDIQPQHSTDQREIPELSTFPATDETTRIEALRLVADSVAQQRQRASRALIFHPLTVLLLAVVFMLLRQFFYKGKFGDYAIIGTTFAGVVMTLLVTIRSLTGGYLEEAERVGTWRWLSDGRGPQSESETGVKVLNDPDDEILVTKFGDDFIGAIVFRGVQTISDPTSQSKKSARKPKASQPRTEIRAWAVRQKYRGKGVGAALLEDAIKAANDKGWAHGGIEIAADHANSKEILPKLLSGFVQQNNDKARKYVEEKVRQYDEANGDTKGKRRR